MRGRRLARGDVDWRPFAGPLSPASQRQAFVILNTLFAWLVNAGYLAGNPLSLSRQRARKARPRVTRYLDDDLWQAVKASVEAMPREHGARAGTLCAGALADFVAVFDGATDLGSRHQPDGRIF